MPLDVPRDRDASFEPQLVKKRQRRLHGVDEMVISLTAKGLTTGEVQAHLAEVYGTDVSRETISKITDAILGEMSDWLNRPLGQVYAAVFIDRVRVKSVTSSPPSGPRTALSASPQTAPETSSGSGSGPEKGRSSGSRC